jgi:hypothetical protein
MNADEMIADLPDGCKIGQSERELLRYVADHFHQAYLARGLKVIDLSDASEFLCELADASRISRLPVPSRPEQPRYEKEVKKPA